MKKKFVHLHLHTEYSLLDGLSKIPKLMSHVKDLGMDSVAVSDHGALYGAIEFYKEAKKAGIKPIIGCEAYTTNIDHRERPERGKFQNFHLLLLAKNEEGYKNLMKLTSIAHIEGYYYRPRVDRETLAKYSKGLICTSACALGEVAQSLIADDYAKAKTTAEWFLDVFGKDYYLEVQRHEVSKFIAEAKESDIKEELNKMADSEKKINEGVVKLSRELGIPIVATNDAHYINQEDAAAQDVLVCVATGKLVSDTKRIRFVDTPTFYVRPPSEMAKLFSDIPDAIGNTVKIAEKCDLTITLDKWFFPEYSLEKGQSADRELGQRAHEGLKERVKKPSSEAVKRLDYELETITKKGYSTYFLIVADFAGWATKHGIVTNTRGSTAGSLVAYALGIVTINPLDYDLPFERFLTPWRPSPPDIDFDIADDRREEVINYLVKTYGENKVAQICTFGRMLSRGAVRDVARVLGYPYATGDRISKIIPPPKQGFPTTIPRALKEVSELKSLYDSDEDSKKVLDLAIQLEGNARHISVHAAGVVIAPDEITNYTPVQLDPEGKKKITQYDMDALDPNVSPGGAVGLLKFDLLGLRNLSILGSALRIIKETKVADIALPEIPLNDQKTFEMLSRGETMGVFQLSGSGMTRYLKDLKPTRVEDLMAMVALYRPGPMASIPEYIERKNNASLVKFIDPRMKEYLGKSYGLLVYQDDVLLTAINLAGYSWEMADKFRKAIGKKIPEEMAKQHESFVEGCVKKGMERPMAEEIFKLIETFAAYGFNKAHAASYGMVAYWTAYLKANFPVEYMTAYLTAESSDTEKISAAINECRRMKIKVLPPDINESGVGFAITQAKDSLNGKAIRFGLSAIKNVGKAAIEAILSAREEAPFRSFADFCSRVDARRVNKKVLESLIKVGALTSFGKRASLLSSADEVRSKVRPRAASGQQDFFSESSEVKAAPVQELVSDVPEFSEEELQALERQLLGLSLSAKPISEILGSLNNFATHNVIEILESEEFPEIVRLVGVVREIRVVVTKKSGQEMAFVAIDDGTAVITAVIFPKVFQETRPLWVEFKPLVISGRIDKRDEEAAILVENVETAESISQGKSSLLIRIPKGVSADNLRGLKETLLGSPGNQKVTLVFESKRGSRFTLPFGVSWNKELALKINSVLK